MCAHLLFLLLDFRVAVSNLSEDIQRGELCHVDRLLTSTEMVTLCRVEEGKVKCGALR